MRYLVTGGTGFIGSALVKRLVADGHTVMVFDDGSRGRWDRLDGVLCRQWPGDVRDPASVAQVVRGADRVVHLAAVNGTRHFYEKPREVLDVAVRGTLNVIDACRDAGVKEFFLASTSETYQMPPIVPTPEDVPLVVPDVYNPRYSYGGGKIAAELLTVHAEFERAVIFRPHNVYGPDMGREHVIPEFIERSLRLHAAGERRFTVQGSGEQTRAFVHIQDFVDGLCLLFERGTPGVYHLGNPAVTTMADLARMVAAQVGLPDVEIVPSNAPAGETPVRCPDITKMRGLGYEPRVTLAEGLKDTVAWYTEHRA